jgi:predicted nucleic acid-binding protein
MLILADSGILLRLFEPSDPLHTDVRNSVAVLQSLGETLVTATQNVAEFWNVCTRPSTARGGFGLDIVQTELRLREVESTFSILADIDTTYAIWRTLVVTQSVQGKQVHDARLAALMLAHGITHILTLNGGDFTRYPGITPIDPASLAALPIAAPSPPPTP